MKWDFFFLDQRNEEQHEGGVMGLLGSVFPHVLTAEKETARSGQNNPEEGCGSY